MQTCDVCDDKGCVRFPDDSVGCCPNCNPDSGYEPGEYMAELAAKNGRCDYAKGGGGRTCYLPQGHSGNHVFQCGR